MSEAPKEKARSAMDDLHQRCPAVAERMGALEHSTAEAWSDLKDGFAASFAAFGSAWEKAKMEFDPS